MTDKPEMLLWLDDHRGQYIPRDFANSFTNRDRDVSGISANQWQTLESGPDNEFYWDAWDDVLNNAIVTDENGIRYRLHQDSALWLVPVGMEWNEENDCFEWPEENQENN